MTRTRVALQWLAVALVPWLIVPAKPTVESRPVGAATIGASDAVPAIPAARHTHLALRDAAGKSREPRQFGAADVDVSLAIALRAGSQRDRRIPPASEGVVHWVARRAYHTTGPPQALLVV